MPGTDMRYGATRPKRTASESRLVLCSYADCRSDAKLLRVLSYSVLLYRSYAATCIEVRMQVRELDIVLRVSLY